MFKVLKVKGFLGFRVSRFLGIVVSRFPGSKFNGLGFQDVNLKTSISSNFESQNCKNL
jgi:hypothetical protein